MANSETLLRRRLLKRRAAARIARLLLDLNAARAASTPAHRDRVFVGVARG